MEGLESLRLPACARPDGGYVNVDTDKFRHRVTLAAIRGAGKRRAYVK
jgi:hypothetical protein